MSDEYQELFEQYLSVCNQAIEQSKDHFPYKEMWKAGKTIMGDHRIECTVYDNRPKASYSLGLEKDAHLTDIKKEKNPDRKGWKVNYSYLKEVVEHPEKYIQNPAKLDWDWLKDRISN
jgi:hypothetical protein